MGRFHFLGETPRNISDGGRLDRHSRLYRKNMSGVIDSVLRFLLSPNVHL